MKLFDQVLIVRFPLRDLIVGKNELSDMTPESSTLQEYIYMRHCRSAKKREEREEEVVVIPIAGIPICGRRHLSPYYSLVPLCLRQKKHEGEV
jgi:hypothetical protein